MAEVPTGGYARGDVPAQVSEMLKRFDFGFTAKTPNS